MIDSRFRRDIAWIVVRRHRSIVAEQSRKNGETAAKEATGYFGEGPHCSLDANVGVIFGSDKGDGVDHADHTSDTGSALL